MNNKMESLSNAFTLAGVEAVPTCNGRIMVGAYAVVCSLTGNVEARNPLDRQDRIHLGTMTTPDEAIVANFTAYCMG